MLAGSKRSAADISKEDIACTSSTEQQPAQAQQLDESQVKNVQESNVMSLQTDEGPAKEHQPTQSESPSRSKKKPIDEKANHIERQSASDQQSEGKEQSEVVEEPRQQSQQPTSEELTSTHRAENGESTDNQKVVAERHKYFVRNIPYWLNKKATEKFLSKIDGLPPYIKLQKLSRQDHMFIEFENAQLAERGVQALRDTVIKGNALEARKVTEESRKRRRIAETMQRARSTNQPPECKTAGDVTAPWRNIPYEEQVSRKKKMISGALRKVMDAIVNATQSKAEPTLPWIAERTEGNIGKNVECCELENFIEAKEGPGGRDHYRNKTELTVGYTISSCAQDHTHHKREAVAGFSAGAIRDGKSCVVALEEDCITTSIFARHVAKRLTAAIQEFEKRLSVYDRVEHTGYWRNVLIRESSTEEAVVVVTTTSDNVSQQDKEEARVTVLRHLLNPPLKKKVSLLWHHNDKKSNSPEDCNVIKVHGDNHIQETLMRLKFRIHPFSFFQVNTIMAEKMYDAIAEMACLKNTCVLDICCGTGSIGLSIASHAERVIGIELNSAAVEDAVYNAKMNNVNNTIYIAGKAEEVIGKAVALIHDNDCVAIVDPPRAGLHPEVVKAIRATKAIKRVVYAACEANNLWKNATGFCRRASKGYRGTPFKPVKAVGVDMFAHTPHYELLMSFSRT